MSRSLLAPLLLAAALLAAGCSKSADCKGDAKVCGGSCVQLASDNLNCGACGAACATGQVCSQGRCALTCAAGLLECGGGCVDPRSDRAFCGASGACAGSTAGTPCAAGQVCSNGTCALSCQAGLVDCGGTCVDPMTSRTHCGASGSCGVGSAGATCAPGQLCSSGLCALSCQAGLTECSGKCVDRQSDPANCGTCGNGCLAGQVCSAGVCTLSCQAGLLNCGGKCVDPATDRSFCGATGSCSGGEAGQVCAPGHLCGGTACAVSCQAGLADCGGACVDTSIDPAHCGADLACAGGTACGPSQACRSGGCWDLCPAGQLVCDGACTDPSANSLHCGASGDCAGANAGVACGAGEACVTGGCLAASSCTSCHGTTGVNPAPPVAAKTTPADLSTSNRGVGAHQAHLVAGRLRGPIACDECHVVPTDAGHSVGTPPAPVSFGNVAGALATRDGAAPDYGVRIAGRCSSTYCHGATFARPGTNTAPLWAGTAGTLSTQAACGTCHPAPPTTHVNAFGTSIAWSQCSDCHPNTVNADGSIKVPGEHMDGVHQSRALGCTVCHVTSPTSGGHALHGAVYGAAYGEASWLQSLNPSAAPTDAGVAAYRYGCGNCHPTDPAAHGNGVVGELDLAAATAPAGSLKARNGAGAAWVAGGTPTSGTCASVYCHSSGQPSPGFVATPAWDSGATLGCTSCHANPPNYANGGAGTATANSHVSRIVVDVGPPAQTQAVGHFMGLPSVVHASSAHGGSDGYAWMFGYTLWGDSAAPLTCQSCHYRTVDPANTGDSGFYYLDTTGTYEVAGASSDFVSVCTSCHAGSTGPTRARGGAVKPLYHVNGTRDVTFDPRIDLSTATSPTLPASPNTPTRPYWYTRATTRTIGTDTYQDSPVITGALATSTLGTHAGLDGTTYSLDLAAAQWDPATRSCSAVACHVGRLSAGAPPVTWGDFRGAGGGLLYTGSGGVCTVCHYY
jgi:predicted CxxxxCH...CXXCH cytochrome family protein